MSRVSKTLKNLVELDELKNKLESFTRGEVYRKLKPTIDAANKRLKRQGVDLKLSTKGKSSIELITTTQQAINVQPKRLLNQVVNKSKINEPKINKPKINKSKINEPKVNEHKVKQVVNKPKNVNKNVNKQPRTTKVIRQMPLDFASMTREQLVNVIQPTIDAANKRLKRLEGMKTLSPALLHVQKNGGKFSLKGKNRNQVLRESFRAIEFINYKTSTVSGAKEYERNFARKLSKKSQDITNEQRKVLFEAFKKIEDMDPLGKSYYGSDNLVRMLADEVVDNKLTFDEMLDKGLKELDKAYLKWAKEQAEIVEQLNPLNLVKP